MYFVYKIIIADKVRYIGVTGDMVQREKNHNYLCFKKRQRKELYDGVRLHHPEVKELKLIMIREFKKEIDAKRWECFLILSDYFSRKELWQKVPNIIDGGIKKRVTKK